MEVFAPEAIESLTWNGKKLPTSRTSYGSLTATISGSNKTIALPPLDSWKVHDSLPERFANYTEGAGWVDANHMTTANPTKPDTLPVLYVDDYGFHNSYHLYRGYFNGSATAVNLAVEGGMAFGWSAWLNGKLIGSYLGNTTLGTGNLTLSFANGTLNINGPNVLLVLQDNTGHDLRDAATDPRGILKASLEGGAPFSKWKIAGTAAGDNYYQLDPVRGPLNEGEMVVCITN